MKIGHMFVAGTAAAVLALPAFAAENDRTRTEMDRGVPGVDVDVGRKAEGRGGVPGVDVDVNRRAGDRRAGDRGVPGVDVDVGRRAEGRGGVPGVDVDVNRRDARNTDRDRRTMSDSRQDHVRAAQQALQRAGFDPGPRDGVMGPKTQKAVRDFQQSKGLSVSGELDDRTLTALNVDKTASAGSGSRSRSAGSASAGASGTANEANTQCDALQGAARADCLKSHSTASVTSGGAVSGQSKKR